MLLHEPGRTGSHVWGADNVGTGIHVWGAVNVSSALPVSDLGFKVIAEAWPVCLSGCVGP